MSIQIMMTPHVYCLWAVPVKVQIPVCLAYWLTVCKQLPSGSPVHPSAPAASDHRPCCLWSDPSQSASRSLCIQLASPALFGKPRNQIQQILDQTLEIVKRQMTFIASSVFLDYIFFEDVLYLVLIHQIMHHVFVSINRNIFNQLGLGSVQPVVQGLESISESSWE